MAVLDEVPHITARVRVAEELAAEYEVPDDFEMTNNPHKADDTTPRKHCYIECKSDAEFSIEVTVSSGLQIPPKNDAIWMWVYIDGTYMDCRPVYKHKLPKRQPIDISMSSARCDTGSGVSVLKKFTFAPITEVDSASKSKIEKDISRAKGLGIIKILVETARTAKTQCGRESSTNPTSQQPDLAEKALKGKGISHMTTLAETGTVIKTPTCVNVENIVPVGEFFFHYRSHEALQHEMIIPRTPSPEPPVVADDGEDVLSHLSESDIRRLAMERLRDSSTKQESLTVKREADEDTPTPRQWKVVKLDDGKEAVDLTDD